VALTWPWSCANQKHVWSKKEVKTLLLILISTHVYASVNRKCSDALIRAQYVLPQIEERFLSDEAPLLLKPAPVVFAKRTGPHTPVLTQLDSVWDLNQFKQGRAPVSLGKIADPSHFSEHNNIRVLDLPIKMAGSVDEYRIPSDLAQFRNVIQQIIDIEHAILKPEQIKKYYAYLTIDQKYVQPGTSQRRPRAHVDGFQGSSISQKKAINHSYTVSNLTPTVYYTHPFSFDHLIDGVHDYYHEMSVQADETQAVTTKPFHLYLMDAYSVHRAEVAKEGGYRTFLRISYDPEVFSRKGNTRNPLFHYEWELTERPKQNPFLPYRHTAEELMTWLSHELLSADAVVKFISADPMLNLLYEQRLDGWIGEHSREVLKLFEQERVHHDLSFLGERFGTRALPLLRSMLALHDAGKPLAIDANDRAAHTRFTLPILEEKLKSLGFTAQEISFARGLIDQDILGDFLQEKISLDMAEASLKLRAKDLKFSSAQMLKLFTLYYTVDAASYPMIREEHFVMTDAGLQIKSQKYEELKTRVE